jgi:hypothetical protein
MLRDLQRIHGEFNANVSLDLPTTVAIIKFLCGLRSDGEAVIVKPIN